MTEPDNRDKMLSREQIEHICEFLTFYHGGWAQDILFHDQAQRDRIAELELQLTKLLTAIGQDVGYRFDAKWAHRGLQDAVKMAQEVLVQKETP